MQSRQLGRTGRQVSVVGLGCWQLGADWGDVDEDDAMAVLHAAVDAGVTFLDTADVYGDGRSEPLDRQAPRRAPRRRRSRSRRRWAAGPIRTCPRRSRSRPSGPGPTAVGRNLGVDRLDLVQLHCPPTPVLADDRVYDALDTLVDEELDRGIRRLGRDVRRGADGDGPAQRRHGADHPQRLPAQAARAGAARCRGRRGRAHRSRAARDGLLSGKYDESTTSRADDHRTYNRGGEAFDVGETFSGVPFEVGVRAARRVTALARARTLPPRWRCAGSSTRPASAPSSRRPQRRAGTATPPLRRPLDPLGDEVLDGLRDIYDEEIREHVHSRW